jgi:alpha-mannosidase
VIPPGCAGNVITLYDDVPFYWCILCIVLHVQSLSGFRLRVWVCRDAWDVMPYHLETRKPAFTHAEVRVIEAGPYRAVVEVSAKLGVASVLRQLICVVAGSATIEFQFDVDWHETHTLMKLEFPLSVRCTDAAYETQFGWLRRPTTANTSWEVAKYEVCGHRWADVSESGFGVALLNDCKYGHSVRNGVMALVSWCLVCA